jgi:hypothetical protein
MAGWCEAVKNLFHDPNLLLSDSHSVRLYPLCAYSMEPVGSGIEILHPRAHLQELSFALHVGAAVLSTIALSTYPLAALVPGMDQSVQSSLHYVSALKTSLTIAESAGIGIVAVTMQLQLQQIQQHHHVTQLCYTNQNDSMIQYIPPYYNFLLSFLTIISMMKTYNIIKKYHLLLPACYHLLLPLLLSHLTITSYYHLLLPSLTIISHYHLLLSSLTTTPYYHLLLPSLTIISYITSYYYLLPSFTIISYYITSYYIISYYTISPLTISSLTISSHANISVYHPLLYPLLFSNLYVNAH